MEARCTGCGGRVMPYHQYIVHFKPTATCMSCGERVRFRHFFPVMSAIVVALLAFTALALAADSVALGITAAATFLILALIGDFWTYRNLSWDPVRSPASPSEAPPSGAASRVTRSQ